MRNTALVSLLVIISVSLATKVSATPVGATLFPGQDQAPTFVSSCDAAVAVAYSTHKQVVLYNIESNETRLVFQAPHARSILWVAPSCAPSGVIYFGTALRSTPTSLQIHSAKVSSALAVLEVRNYTYQASILATSFETIAYVFGESVYYFGNVSNKIVPIRATHDATQGGTFPLWSLSPPQVDDIAYVTMSLANDILFMFIKGRGAYAPVIGLANVSRTDPVYALIGDPGIDFSARNFPLEDIWVTDIYVESFGKPQLSIFKLTNSSLQRQTITINQLDSLVTTSTTTFPVNLSALNATSLQPDLLYRDPARLILPVVRVLGSQTFFTLFDGTTSFSVRYNLISGNISRGDFVRANSTVDIAAHYGRDSAFFMTPKSVINVFNPSIIQLGGEYALGYPGFGACLGELYFTVCDSNRDCWLSKAGKSNNQTILAYQGRVWESQLTPPPLVAQRGQSCVVLYATTISGWTFGVVRGSTFSGGLRYLSNARFDFPGAEVSYASAVANTLPNGVTLHLKTSLLGGFSEYGRLMKWQSPASYGFASLNGTAPNGEQKFFAVVADRINPSGLVSSLNWDNSSLELSVFDFASSDAIRGRKLSFSSEIVPEIAEFAGGLACVQAGVTSEILLVCFNRSSASSTAFVAFNFSQTPGTRSEPFEFVSRLNAYTYHFQSSETVLLIQQNASNLSSFSVKVVAQPAVSSIYDMHLIDNYLWMISSDSQANHYVATMSLSSMTLNEAGRSCSDRSTALSIGGPYLLHTCPSLGNVSLYLVSTANPLAATQTLIHQRKCLTTSACSLKIGKFIAPSQIIVHFVDLGVVEEVYSIDLKNATFPVATQLLVTAPSKTEISAIRFSDAWRRNNAVNFAYFWSDAALYLTNGTDLHTLSLDISFIESVTLFRAEDRTLRAAWSEQYYFASDLRYSLSYYSDSLCFVDSDCPASHYCSAPLCVGRASPESCSLPAPAPNALCTASGWSISGDFIISINSSQISQAPVAPRNSSSPAAPIVIVIEISSNVTVSGNLVIYTTTTSNNSTGNNSSSSPNVLIVIQLRQNATVTVSGCVSLGGALNVELPSDTISGSEKTLMTFGGGYCENKTSTFDKVTGTRAGAPECEKSTSAPRYETTSLSVAFSFSQEGCVSGPSTTSGGELSAAEVGFQLWMIGPIVGGVILIASAVVVIIIVNRRRLIPSYRLGHQLRKMHTNESHL